MAGCFIVHILFIGVIALIYYTIRPGDSIYKLAAQFRIPIDAILSYNPGLYPYNLLVGQQIMLPVGPGDPAQDPQTATQRISANELALRNTLRELWVDYVYWIRMAINAIASNSPELNSIINRLSRNASDIAAALSPYYGEANAAKFESLFRDFLNHTLQWIRALAEGNTQAAQNAQRQAYAIADQIADFLNTLNPNWSSNNTRTMLYNLLALIQSETAARLSHDYDKSVAVYDQMKNQTMSIADMIAEGIVKQFPTRF
jgi:LysM repeat protein